MGKEVFETLVDEYIQYVDESKPLKSKQTYFCSLLKKQIDIMSNNELEDCVSDISVNKSNHCLTISFKI